SDLARDRRGDIDLLLGVEKRGELIKLLLLDGIVLVIVALRAAYGKAKPNRAQRGCAVEHLLITELFGIGATLTIRQRVAIEAGSDYVIDGAVRQQVARELLDGELVERHIAVERFDHPLPPAPGPRAGAVFFIAVAIGVSRQVQPVTRPFFAVVR